MIGTALIEAFVQSVALSHRVKGHTRCSALLLAAPESGKTTVSRAANCQHVVPVAILSGRSIVAEATKRPEMEFMLFNDLSAVRALSQSAVGLAVTILNQITQGEHGLIGFAGKDTEQITRTIGIIGCMPYKIFNDHRARWKEMGFISRMIPFAYSYSSELVAEIKDAIDDGTQASRAHPGKRMITSRAKAVTVTCPSKLTMELRRIADARAETLGQLGIRLLQNYHCLVRAHALRDGRRTVNASDLVFLRAVDRFVSITTCAPLNGDHI